MKRIYTSGIYLIRNNITGRVYIGQSKNIEIRNKTELLKKSINLDFINDVNIYGVSAFSCSTLEVIHSYDKNLMNARERFYISLYNSKDPYFGYNKTRGNYKTIEEYKAKYTRDNSSLFDIQHRKIKCLETGEIFDSYKQAYKIYGNEVFRSIYKRRVLDQKRTFVLLTDRSKLDIIEEPIKKPEVSKNRVSFIIEDSFINSHSFSYNELLPSWCSIILRVWVEDQERKEKRRMKYAEKRKSAILNREAELGGER